MKSDHSSVGRAPDCRGIAAIRRSLVRIRVIGYLFASCFSSFSILITLILSCFNHQMINNFETNSSSHHHQSQKPMKNVSFGQIDVMPSPIY
jgi:hypothetical protein